MKIGKLYRDAVLNELEVSDDGNAVSFSFSSEAPVERWFGEEVLSHDPGAMNLVRVKAGAAPFLWNHDSNEPIGMVGVDAKVAGKIGRGSATYFTTPFAQEKKQQWNEGLRNVSFMYQIDEMKETRAATKEMSAQYTATKYTVYEISQVAIPADFTVGGKREESKDAIEVKITNKQIESKGVRSMDKETTEKPVIDIEQYKTDGAQAERVRINAITELGKKFKQEDIARQLIDSGKSVDEARAAVLEKIGQKQVPLNGDEAVVGLTGREIQKYSFLKAMRAMAYPQEKQFQKEAAFEREVSEAAQTKGGKAARGFMVPVDILRASQRDLTVGTSTAGGNLVATDLMSGSFIELLRNKSVAQAAGATVLNGLVGNIAIPKATSSSTAYWVAESGAPTESQQAVGQVSMSPKSLAAYTDISRKLLLQSSVDVESFVKNDLAAVIALELDRVAFYGTGSSNQPSGLKPYLAGGNQEKNFAAATPTFAEIISLETAITSANGDIGSMKYIVNASMKGSLKGAVKVSSYPVFIMDSDGSMNGYPTLVSNQIASGDVLFGVWNQMIMGFWSGLDLLVDPYSQSTSGTVRTVVFQDCDIAFRHAESFARGNDTP